MKIFKPHNSKTILSLQYCKLIREQSENAEKWMSIFENEGKCMHI